MPTDQGKWGPQEGDSPLLKQFWDAKAQTGDALLLFRMGDFYELFGQDAIDAATILEITLTSRDKNKPNPLPMCGVPHHSAQSYIQRLLAAGKKVAICEQMEDPAVAKSAKSIVRREVVRIFTPGIQLDLEGSESNYIATVAGGESAYALACLDISTGESLVSGALTRPALEQALVSRRIRHLLLAGLPDARAFGEILPEALVEELPSNYLTADQARKTLRSHYEIETAESFLPAGSGDAGLVALGTLLLYSARSQKVDRLPHLRLPVPFSKPETMALSASTVQHLDLLPSLTSPVSLFQIINRTACAMGARELKRWLLSPLKDVPRIEARQAAVQELAAMPAARQEKLGGALREAYDLERILGRAHTGLANPRDTLALGKTLALLPALAPHLAQARSERLRALGDEIDRLAAKTAELAGEITRTQAEDAPLVARDGGIFREGTDPELDRLLSINSDGQKWLVEFETRERAATGISSLKVRYNRVFGYYIEITQSNLKSVPAHYQRKQTTVGAERFTTEELAKYEDEIVNASSRQKALEQELFTKLLERVRAATRPVMDVAAAISELDSLLSLSRLAQEPGWRFPQIDESLDLQIERGRHPLVDQPLASGGRARGEFVPNDLSLTGDSRRGLIITGPNMGGKSTIMRQVALITILGQMGAPVPAQSARWGLVSAVHTRIGAHDAIARGQSTFMVEMAELARILHEADERSLIVLDEIGRGTSTYDGISVAWASLEWIARRVKSRTLFATHYHELTRLAGEFPLFANAHMAVDSDGRKGGLRFLYLLKDGPANESFGIHVARIAGLPKPLIDRAWEVLADLEQGARDAQSRHGQLSLFGDASPTQEEPTAPRVTETPPAVDPITESVISDLADLDVNRVTPLEALNILAGLKARLADREAFGGGGGLRSELSSDALVRGQA